MKDTVRDMTHKAIELVKEKNELDGIKIDNLNDLKIMKIMADTPIPDDADLNELLSLDKAYMTEQSIINKDLSANQELINDTVDEISDYQSDLTYNVEKLNEIESKTNLFKTATEKIKIQKRIELLQELKIYLFRPDLTRPPILNNKEMGLNLNNDQLKSIHTEKKTEPDGVEKCIDTDVVSNNDMSDANKRNIHQWINEINPNYDPYDVHSGYSTNCGSCALAVYQRLEGNNRTTATKEVIGTLAEMKNITGMEQIAMNPDEIEEYLKYRGPGSHVIVGIDRAKGPGHWFNAYYDGENVVAIDGQTGLIQPWPPNYGDVTKWDISVKL